MNSVMAWLAENTSSLPLWLAITAMLVCAGTAGGLGYGLATMATHHANIHRGEEAIYISTATVIAAACAISCVLILT